MAGPIYNQPISGAGQEQGYAASASVIISGLEKDLNQKINNIRTTIIDPKVQLKTLEEYLQKLTATATEEEVKKREEKEKKGQPQPQKKRKGAFQIKTRKFSTPPKTIALKTSFHKKNGEALKVDPKLLREYVLLQVKHQSGIPEEEQEEIKKRLSEIEDQFKQEHIPPELLHLYRSKVEIIIKRELLSLIKNMVFENLQNPYEVFDRILGQKNAQELIKIVSGEIELEEFNLKTLVCAAKETGVNLDKWIAYWNFDKVKITPEGNVIISAQLEEKNLLKDHLRSTYIEFLLVKGWLKKAKDYFKIHQEIKKAQNAGFSEEEIKNILEQARHMAWLRLISALRDLHLKRVLSGSETEFLGYTKDIEKLTAKARKLTGQISEKGHTLIEAKLETLAIEAARYKLEFLKSMQNIEFQPQREKDILWIEHFIDRLKH